MLVCLNRWFSVCVCVCMGRGFISDAGAIFSPPPAQDLQLANLLDT